MAVVLTCNDGCVLDHERAIISAYSHCNFPATFLPSLQHRVEENKEEYQIKDASDISSGDALQSLESVSGNPQYLYSHNTDGAHECGSTVSKHWTATSKDDNRVEECTFVPSEHAVSSPEHFVQPAANEILLKQCKERTCVQKHMVNNTIEVDARKREAQSSQSPSNARNPNSKQQTNETVKNGTAINNLVNKRLSQHNCPTNTRKSETALCQNCKDNQEREMRFELGSLSSTDADHSQSGLPYGRKLKKLSLRLKQGFFAMKVPFMMDSQFEKVKNHFMQEGGTNKEYRKQIDVADIHQLFQSKKRKRKLEKETRNTDEPEEMLTKVHTSLALSARVRGLFLKHIPLPLDNNLASRQHAQLDGLADVFASLLITSDGAPILHMGECLKPLVIQGSDCVTFSAAEMIHRRVCHKSTEASVLNVDGTGYVLPPCSEFLLSNLQDFCDHLFLELDENGYDLIVLDPPWENKSVKRKKSYDMVNEEDLQRLPLSHLSRPGCLVGVWVTNNERLEDYCRHTLFPCWGLTALARWHWLKVTQTGDMVCSMDGHKKPYEVLLLARASGSCGDSAMEQARKGLPESSIMMSVPCSLHSKKPPLADVLQPYLPASPKCLELFARNLWPHWTSWGREVLKHQNLIFYDVVDNM